MMLTSKKEGRPENMPRTRLIRSFVLFSRVTKKSCTLVWMFTLTMGGRLSLRACRCVRRSSVMSDMVSRYTGRSDARSMS